VALIFPNENHPEQYISAICYTKGPGMGGPLQSCAIAASTLSLLWDVPLERSWRREP
jgi:N6-L-threonylcarbamoyladenine synthase